MNREWSIRGYRHGDEEGIFNLWKTAFPFDEVDREIWIRRWRWKYLDNPAGAAKIMLAEHNGRIIGHCALMPFLIKMGNKIVRCAQYVTIMTHPDYRHQKVFVTLTNKIYEEGANDKILMMYGFPNIFSHPIVTKKLGKLTAFDLAKMKKYVRFFNLDKNQKMKNYRKFLLALITLYINIEKTFNQSDETFKPDSFTISQAFSFDDRINKFWDNISIQLPILAVRNKDYLNWRFVNVPDINYLILLAERKRDICGYLILRFMGKDRSKKCIIFDILAESQAVAQGLIKVALEHCRQQQAMIISCSMIAGKEYRQAFKKNGFIHMPFSRESWFVVLSNLTDISPDFLRNPKNWHVQFGDSDLP